MSAPRAIVLRAPGINCDRETARACRLVGFATHLLHINQLLQAPDLLLDYDFLVIPGGFSYGDDLGAGTLLAKNLTIHLGPQLHRFIDTGRPVLGICNGFQVLVRAGLLPGHSGDHKGILSGGQVSTPTSRPLPTLQETASLTDNASAQFECRWVTLSVQPGPCLFTKDIEHAIELPVAHGEGQFVLADNEGLAQFHMNGQVPLLYARQHVTGANLSSVEEVPYPDNPNGSAGNIAGVCSAQGNVFGLMPHPERYVHALQHPLRRGRQDGQGDGLVIFKNALHHAMYLQGKKSFAAPARSTGAASYAASGVDIAAADRAKALMLETVRATQGPRVLAGMGAFAGMFDAASIKEMRRPALVASTDGVGTKTLIAAQAGRFDTIGHDLVNHSVNDLLTQGARPLFFMDYLAMEKLDPSQAASIVSSVAAACKEVGCALMGGETAEMPGVYLPGAFDLAGTIVGIVEQDAVIDSTAICPGDVLLGLPSSGLHTNGYSLARRIFAPYALDTIFPELGEPLVDALLRPHRCYLQEITLLHRRLAERGHTTKGIAHITGGGFAGNIARILPAGVQAVIETDAWDVPPLFRLLARLGQVSREEMYRTLNMGVGMVLALSPQAAAEARYALPELLAVGHITNGEGVVFKEYRGRDYKDLPISAK
jgi:phosphoribosylformylglycinamidine cyclo-ligase